MSKYEIIKSDDFIFTVFRSDGRCIGTYGYREKTEVAAKVDAFSKPPPMR